VHSRVASSQRLPKKRRRGDAPQGVLVVSVYDLSRAEHLNPHMNMPGKNQDSSLYKGKRWFIMDDFTMLALKVFNL